MPGTAAGTTSRRHASVASATSSIPACSAHSLPDTTMFGLSSIPSSRTRWRRSAPNTRRES
jgi:hypothetical protein